MYYKRQTEGMRGRIERQSKWLIRKEFEVFEKAYGRKPNKMERKTIKDFFELELNRIIKEGKKVKDSQLLQNVLKAN